MISIIIPVYNAEKFLRRCLDSIVNQTYKDLDIVLVDDGSSDNSGTICDEYASKDSRIHVIHQQNGGVSVARQAGLDAIKGEYFIFADADDWVELTMLEKLYLKAKESDADVVVCAFFQETEKGWNYSSQYFPDDIPNNELIKRMLGYLHGSCWNKLVRASCAKDVKFSPSDIYVFEDELFIVKILAKDVKVVYYEEAFYHYCLNKGSLSQTFNLNSFLSIQKEIGELEMILNDEIKEYCVKRKKQYALSIAFLAKQFNLLNTTYTEVHDDIIMEGQKYNMKLPLKSCMTLALKGYPRLAYLLYSINIIVIRFADLMKRIIKIR